MKKNQLFDYLARAGWKKWLRIMKLTTFFILLFIIDASASFSQSTKVSVKVENGTLSEIFSKIEEQSEYRFFYQNEQIRDAGRKTIDVTDKNIIDLVNELLEETRLSCRLVDRNIIIFPKAENPIGNMIIQQKIISGKVTDFSGAPLPGVTVMIKGTTQGTITDNSGNYSLTDVPGNSTLVFSFVGMKTREVKVEGGNTVNVKMEEGTFGIEEVVAIGYGTTTQRKMVSSVSSITTNKIADAPYTSVINGLAGRTAGLFVQESGGEYGSVPTISIRGGGEPIYVIDGIMASKNEFAFIPAGDIEKISFLKDAAACAVYGFNSANGVVLITTKKGGEEKITLTYSGNLAIQSPTLMPDYLSAYQIAKLKNTAAFNDGLPPMFNDETLNILKNNLDPVKYPNFNAFDEAVKKGAMQRNHNISLAGTINNTSIFMSLDYFGQDGIYKVNDHGLNRYSFRSNISHTFPNIGLRVDGNVSLQRNVKTSTPYPATVIWEHVKDWSSGTPLYNPDGNYTTSGLPNPMAEADSRAGYNNEESNRVNGRLSFVWDVPKVKGLTLKAIGNYRLDYDFNKLWCANQRLTAPTYNWANQMDDMGKPSLTESMGRIYSYNLEGHINYLRTFAEVHTIELTGVYLQSETQADGFSAFRKDFASSAVDQLFAGSEVGKTNDGNASERGLIGYVGRLKYDYDTKYILEGNFRYDGYDGFAPGQKYKLFPSMSFGWNIDREEFARSALDKIKMNSLKLRVSWGVLGKLGENGEDSRFSYLSAYNLINNIYYIDGTWRTGFSEGPLTPSSGTTSWYDVESKNLGFDFGFFDSKLSGSVDWFYYRTTGFLGSPSAKYTTPLGQDLPKINTNSAHRRGGLELSMNYKANIGQIKLNIGGNISYYDELWEKKYDEDTTSLKNPYSRQTHQKDYFTRGYINLGYYQDLNDILNSPRRLGSIETMPGDLKYQDFNGDGRLDGDDQVRIGKSEFAHILYGITLDAEYKGFNLSALLQGTSNRQVYLGYNWQNELNHKIYTIQADSWTTENRDAMFPRISTFNNVNGSNNIVTSDFWLKNAWYLRLKSLSLSYDLKTTLLKDFNEVNRFVVLFSATNLLTISPLNKYFMDPEAGSSDNYGYPVCRTLSVGVRITF